MITRKVHTSLPWTDAASAQAYLAGLGGHPRSRAAGDPSTRRVEAITAGLGCPNRRYPAVHITGTNGKGSTSAMTTRLFRGRGLRVGTYTSPHVRSVTERIAVNEEPVSVAHFADALGRVAWMARRVGVTPTWFEAVTAAAFVVFADAEVDVAVVEVGMLGRWDATNVVRSTVAVVTNVALDHTDRAGPSRVHIATEKAGIVHPGAVLVLGETDPVLVSIFAARNPRRLLRSGVDVEATRRRVTHRGSTVDLTTPWGAHRSVPVALLGRHQCHNAALATAAAQCFLNSDLDAAVIRRALAGVRLAGRAEVIGSEPTVLVDGAHNGAAAAALRATVDEHFPTARRRVLVCGMSGSRDPADLLTGIGAADFDLVVATECGAPDAVSADVVAASAHRLGIGVTVAADAESAVGAVVDSAAPEDLVVVAGSFHLVAPAHAALSARRRAGALR
ncbi:bifunctional folylpolyglutamate synthase/dihydrofolate synthase [Mycolicibacterium sp.]|uniref:bifunctional folylpolyglutamate synthase/dihydrofolate synthase n=1 Tax=Mycolicibacterium sp. TaxID=2320850 RepID=UPI003D0C160B